MSKQKDGSPSDLVEDDDQNELDENQDLNNPLSNDEGGEGSVQSPFTSGRFVGKTVEQVEQEFELERTNAQQRFMDQSRNLTQMNNRLEELNEKIKEKPGVEVERPSAADFFSDPVKHNEELTRRVVREEMNQIVAPFKQNLVSQESDRAYQRMEAEFPRFKKIRQYIDQAIQQGNLAVTYENLRYVYFSALGVAVEQGIDLDDEKPESRGPSRQAPPQHRASNQPIRTPAGAKQRRKLTEEEKAFCRQQGWSEERFHQELELNEEEFLDTDLSPKK